MEQGLLGKKEKMSFSVMEMSHCSSEASTIYDVLRDEFDTLDEIESLEDIDIETINCVKDKIAFMADRVKDIENSINLWIGETEVHCKIDRCKLEIHRIDPCCAIETWLHANQETDFMEMCSID